LLPASLLFPVLAAAGFRRFLRAVRWSPTILVAASRKTSPSPPNPSTWAVVADIPITTVTSPAVGVPESATGLAGLATAGAAGGGVIAGSTLATLTGLIGDVLLMAGVAGTDASTGGGASAGRLAGEACGDGVVAAGVLDADLPGDGAGAVTVTVPAAAGIVVMAGLVAAPAVAVRVTEVTDVAPEATVICACIWKDEGDNASPIDPIEQAAVPSPLGQRLVNAAAWPCGAAVSVTSTPDADPFSTKTCTVYDAAWPGLMLT
jgi:hypothetical protein